jgi:hypothetical protein
VPPTAHKSIANNASPFAKWLFVYLQPNSSKLDPENLLSLLLVRNSG